MLREQLSPQLKGPDRSNAMRTITNRALAELSKRHADEYDRFYDTAKSAEY